MKKLLLSTLFCFFAVYASAQQTFQVNSISHNVLLQGMKVYGSGEGYVVGDSGVAVKINANGSTTTLTTNTTENLWRVGLVPGSNGQKLVVVGDDNTILKSTDGGQNFVKQSVAQASGSFVFGVQCIDSLTYYACGGDFNTLSGTVLKTVDGGQNWTIKPLTGSLFVDNVFFLDKNTGFAAGSGSSFTNGSIFKTTDGGQNWTQVKTSTDLFTNVYMLNANTILAVGIGGQILKSTDGGQNWTDHSYNTEDLYGIYFADASIGYACGGKTKGTLLKTTDGGDTWTELNTGFNGIIYAADAVNNTLYLSASGGTWIKSAITTGINNLQNELFTVYPNPVSKEIIIFSESGNEMKSCVVIVNDAMGRVVLKEDNVILNRPVPLAGLPKGMYVLTLTGSDGKIKYNHKIIVE